MRQVKRVSCLFLLVLVMLFGCAMFEPDRTAPERYYAALKFYNDNLQDYLTAYDKAPPVTQAEWDAKIKPVLIEAGAALDLWRLYISDNGKELFWNQMKQKLLITLIKYGVVEGG